MQRSIEPQPAELASLILTWGLAVSIACSPILARAAETQVSLLPILNQAEIHIEHRLIAHELLMLIPPSCRSALKNFYVQYDHPLHRGLSSKSTMILTGNIAEAEFRALFLHEFGHIMDLGCLEGAATAGSSDFRDGKEVIFHNDPSITFYRISWVNEHKKKKGTTSQDFVSGYAASDAFEDFAESFAYFILQHSSFEERARQNTILAQKFSWFTDHLSTMSHSSAQGRHRWNGSIPWDVTKLPYTWRPALASKP